MKRFKVFLAAVFFILNTYSITIAGDFSLTVVHVNDTHSHLEGDWLKLKIQSQTVSIPVGGFARLKTCLKAMRAKDPLLLFLHAGDNVQGTLYFTLFDGRLEYELLNSVNLDAMVFGNHEFDRGVKYLPGWIKRSRFPWLASNIDFSAEPAIAPLVKTYVIKEINGEKVGIIGLTTEKTPFMTLNVGKTVFLDPVETAQKYVSFLTSQGVNKIIALSHLGYYKDCELAARVPGIDIIVGGHSHSLLGDPAKLSPLGLVPQGPYPTEIQGPDGKKVLIVQAWQWAHVVGNLKVLFSPEGEIKDYQGRIVIPAGNALKENGRPVLSASYRYRELMNAILATGVVQPIKEDREILNRLSPYRQKIEKYKLKVVGKTYTPLERGPNEGLGHLVADAIREKIPGAQIALYNSGGVRRDLLAGKITAKDVAEVLPFGNTLVVMDLTGKEIKEALEEGINFLFRQRGKNPALLPYVSGIKVEIDISAPFGERVKSIYVEEKNGRYVSLDPDTSYRVVVNSFMAAGGDGFTHLRNSSGFRQDTGFSDLEAFMEYIKKRRLLQAPREKRILIIGMTLPHDDLPSALKRAA